MNHEQDPHILFRKYLDGQATQEDLQYFLRITCENDVNGTLHELIDDYLRSDEGLHADVDVLAPLLSTLDGHLRKAVGESPNPRRIHRRATRWKYAAAVLIAATAVWGILRFESSITPDTSLLGNTHIDVLPPVTNRARLLLGDGREIQLSEQQEALVIGEQDIRYMDGSPVLSQDDLMLETISVSTPAGSTYKVILSDGTEVTLNAATTLIYPKGFTKNKRQVSLQGEAYFAVAKRLNPQTNTLIPFEVTTSGPMIEVLGTEFNVRAYECAQNSTVALISGRVAVHRPSTFDGANNDHLVIAPGQMATLAADGRLFASEADLAHETAWTNEMFSFKNKDFHEVMDELARWYDVEIVYDGEIPDALFFGIAHRSEKLSLILSLLESAQVSYRLETDLRRTKPRLIISNRTR